MTKNQDRHVWIDLARIIGSFLVVMIHVTSPILTRYQQISQQSWMSGNFYDSIARLSVPMFFMITGALLLGKTEPLPEYFRKRLTKVLIPLVAWSLVYFFWAYWADQSGLTLKRLAKLWYSPAYYHLWYLYALLGLYLVIPILRMITLHSDAKLLGLYIALWFTASGIFPLLEKTLEISLLPDLQFASGFAGYLVAGYFLSKTPLSKRWAAFSALLMVCSAIGTIALTYIASSQKGQFVGTYYEYLSPNIILLSTSAFYLVRWASSNLPALTGPSHKAIQTLASASLGIYLVHIIPMTLLEKGMLGINLTAWSFNPLFAIPATTLAVYCASLAITVILQRIPLINKIVP